MDGMKELNLNELEEVTGGKDNGGYTRRPAPKAGCDIYQIVKGDNLTRIAKRFNTTVSYLMAINPELTNANFIVEKHYIYVPAR